MISWDTPPGPEDKAASMMDDAFLLLRAYQRTTGELGVPKAIALLAETDQRRLNV